MSSTIARPRDTACLIVAVCTVLAPLDSAIAADAAAVRTLLGAWGGNGRVTYTDGTSENLRCTANYTGGGSDLRMAIQCKSDTNTIHVRSRLRIDGSRAAGEWEERTFNANGSASGTAGSGSMSLGISGAGISGSMSVSFSSASHNVSITTQGIAMSRVSMSFSRRS
jgi:hypothetical protein